MGRVKKGVLCSIQKCTNKSVRSLSIMNIGNALNTSNYRLKNPESRKAYLCETHYKVIKKQLKKTAKFDPVRGKFQGSQRFQTKL
ncbi:MAG: hypothetical protein ACTSUV_00730 [Candidatus Ranarchaeia archaeon]